MQGLDIWNRLRLEGENGEQAYILNATGVPYLPVCRPATTDIRSHKLRTSTNASVLRNHSENILGEQKQLWFYKSSLILLQTFVYSSLVPNIGGKNIILRVLYMTVAEEVQGCGIFL